MIKLLLKIKNKSEILKLIKPKLKFLIKKKKLLLF